MNKYIKPDFAVTIYEIDDVITASGDPIDIDTSDPDGGGDWL